MSKSKSRWRGGAQRYSTTRTVEHASWVPDLGGGLRLVRKMLTEAAFVAVHREPYGWHNGARVRKV
jgi:hypothetical protein